MWTSLAVQLWSPDLTWKEIDIIKELHLCHQIFIFSNSMPKSAWFFLTLSKMLFGVGKSFGWVVQSSWPVWMTVHMICQVWSEKGKFCKINSIRHTSVRPAQQLPQNETQEEVWFSTSLKILMWLPIPMFVAGLLPRWRDLLLQSSDLLPLILLLRLEYF